MRREVEAWVEGYEGSSGGIYKSVRVLTRNKIKKMFTTSDKSVKRVDFRPRD